MKHFSSTEKDNCQARILYPAKISFRNEGEIKTFPEEEKLEEFVTSKHILNR